MQRRVVTVFKHTQPTASDVWRIQHNLSAYPVVDVFVDYNGRPTKIVPLNIGYESKDVCVITFTQPFSGFATVV